MRRYDLVVIGSGPAGHHAAIQAAKLGRSVAVVEAQPRLGGAGLNTGTVPSKALREAVLAWSRARARGFAAPPAAQEWDHALGELLARCRRVVEQEGEVYRAQLARNRVDVLHGAARFLSPWRLAVEGPDHTGEVEAGRIVIATGSRPARSERIPVDGEVILDTDGVLGLRRLPRTLVVVGGGVAGVEYACLFAALRVRVVLVDLRPRLLEFADGEIAEALCYHMREAGILLRLGEEVEQVVREPGGGVAAVLKSRKQVRGDVLLYAVGRQGNTEGLNLAAAGLQADARGRIRVNAHYQTAVPHIYAVGDVVGFPGLASVAMEQGRRAACHACGVPRSSDPRLFPYGIYSIPEVSFVGQTEEQLTAGGVPYEVGVAHYRELARGQILGDPIGRLKLLFHRETREVLGVHIIGEGAAELVHIGQAVLGLGGRLEYFVDHVFNYPTLAEAYRVAALAGLNRLVEGGAAGDPAVLAAVGGTQRGERPDAAGSSDL